MSFAENVKNEVAHYVSEDPACRMAELSALLCMGGTILHGQERTAGIEFSTSNNAVARKALTMWTRSFTLRPEVLVRRGLKLRKKNIYTLRLPPSREGFHLLEVLALAPPDGEFRTLQLKRGECRQAFLRGAFMGGGSVNQPQRDYHLELLTGNIFFARRLLRIMCNFHLPAKMTDRKGKYLIYIKEGDGVSNFLQYIGASQAYMQFENIRVLKELRNNVNRVVNCETANLQKTVDAAMRQLRNIHLLQASGRYRELTPKIQDAAELRLQNPEASLGELAEMSGLTKSGLMHRYKKLADLAKTIEGTMK